MDTAFTLAVREIWQDGDLRREARAAYKQVITKCDRLTTNTIPRATTPHGYQVGCTRPMELSVDDKMSGTRTVIISIPDDLG